MGNSEVDPVVSGTVATRGRCLPRRVFSTLLLSTALIVGSASVSHAKPELQVIEAEAEIAEREALASPTVAEPGPPSTPAPAQSGASVGTPEPAHGPGDSTAGQLALAVNPDGSLTVGLEEGDITVPPPFPWMTPEWEALMLRMAGIGQLVVNETETSLSIVLEMPEAFYTFTVPDTTTETFSTSITMTPRGTPTDNVTVSVTYLAYGPETVTIVVTTSTNGYFTGQTMSVVALPDDGVAAPAAPVGPVAAVPDASSEQPPAPGKDPAGDSGDAGNESTPGDPGGGSTGDSTGGDGSAGGDAGGAGSGDSTLCKQQQKTDQETVCAV